MTDDATSTSPYSFAALKEAVSDFLADEALTQAAAIAYYTALSFAPLIVLVTLIVGGLIGPDAEQRVVDQVTELMGPGVGDTVGEVMAGGDEKKQGQIDQVKGGGLGTFTGILGIAAIAYSASGVFAQLQGALNKIWDVEPAPGQGILGWVRKRLLSFGVILTILFLLLVTLAVTGVLQAVFGDGGGIVWKVLNFVLSIAIYVALFGLIFKYLPDVNIPWKAVWVGAAVTADPVRHRQVRHRPLPVQGRRRQRLRRGRQHRRAPRLGLLLGHHRLLRRRTHPGLGQAQRPAASSPTSTPSPRPPRTSGRPTRPNDPTGLEQQV